MNTRESHRIICLTKLGQFTVLYLNAQIMFNDCDFVGEKKNKGKKKEDVPGNKTICFSWQI